MKAYIHTKHARPDGTYDSFLTVSVDVKVDELWWQKQGLSFTSSEFARHIPTRYKVKYNGRWRRVYAICYSNTSTLFLGRKYTNTCNVDVYHD